MNTPLTWRKRGDSIQSGDAFVDYEIRTDDQITYKLFVIADDTFMAHEGTLIECQRYAQAHSDCSLADEMEERFWKDVKWKNE